MLVRRSSLLALLLLAVLLLAVTAAHAQNGCVDSPECPTAVLGLVGAAAITLARRFKR